ncbi:hypothetical protein BCV69DRAFT_276720 [Microstroma glucosiphilum]|uniref:Uncharacterized protein n=1 Tax=Pseudomicrostroma glucosiphilum TaxID=1684307 RepID=A0A316UA36_9BASI|nr:hypothetical protein BCV69DRAFT_276720 [Pseudomicrostroma glucosiphilum]PWN22019.1 hypothetical protein BCV69DRAFT_276720 [Pseudomicrostroma glucosiphilum]
MPKTSAAHPRQLDKAWDGISKPIASATSSRNPSVKRTPSAAKGKGRAPDSSGSVQRTASSSSRNHQGHTRHDSEALSVIGESSFSEGRPSGLISRGVSVDGIAALAPFASVARDEAVPATKVAEEGESKSPSSENLDEDTPIRPSEATWLSRSNSKMSSSGSGYVSAASHLNSAAPGGTSPGLQSDHQSRTEAIAPARAPSGRSGGSKKGKSIPASTQSPLKTGAGSAAVLSAVQADELDTGGGSATSTQSSQDPFKSPISASTEGNADPFASSARGPQAPSVPQVNPDVAAGANATTNPAVSAAPALNVVMPSPEGEDPAGTSTAAAPLPPAPVAAETTAGRTRTWSNVIRLKTPTPGSGRRPRTASPSGPSGGALVNRSASGSKTSRNSSTKSARRSKYPHFLQGTHDLQKTKSLSGAKAVPGSGAAGADLRRAASTGATRGPEAQLSPQSWAYTSRAAEWRTALDASAAASRDTAGTFTGSENAGAVPTVSVTGVGDLIMPQGPESTLERKPSIGVAGSRFKETFE